MSKIQWSISAVLLVIALTSAIFLMQREQSASQPTEVGTGNAAVGASGASTIITYTDAGFIPADVTVAVGTTLTWSNESTYPLWVADTDTASCPEDPDFNQCAEVGTGGSYSYTVTETGNFTYENRERAADKGTITVTVEAAPAGPINPEALPQ